VCIFINKKGIRFYFRAKYGFIFLADVYDFKNNAAGIGFIRLGNAAQQDHNNGENKANPV
jgi:hypothetical protein